MEKQRKQEETLKLIALFRAREMLWDMKSSAYRRKDLKKKALEEIAAECDSTVDAVQRRIKALRSTYVIEKKKMERSRRSVCEGGSVYEPTLHWYNEMSFLDDSIVIRKPVDNDERKIPFDSHEISETVSNQSLDSELSYSPPTSKRKLCQEDELTLKCDDALNKLIHLIKPTRDVYSAFAESMVMQLRSMPEQTAHKTITDIQNLLYKRKFEDCQLNFNERFENTLPTLVKHDSD